MKKNCKMRYDANICKDCGSRQICIIYKAVSKKECIDRVVKKYVGEVKEEYVGDEEQEHRNELESDITTSNVTTSDLVKKLNSIEVNVTRVKKAVECIRDIDKGIYELQTYNDMCGMFYKKLCEERKDPNKTYNRTWDVIDTVDEIVYDCVQRVKELVSCIKTLLACNGCDYKYSKKVVDTFNDFKIEIKSKQFTLFDIKRIVNFFICIRTYSIAAVISPHYNKTEYQTLERFISQDKVFGSAYDIDGERGNE